MESSFTCKVLTFSSHLGMLRATMNFFVPFTVSIKPLLEAIQEKERILEQIASMATMERTKCMTNLLQRGAYAYDNIDSLTKLDEIEAVLNYIQKDMQSLNRLDGMYKFEGGTFSESSVRY